MQSREKFVEKPSLFPDLIVVAKALECSLKDLMPE